MFQRFSPFKALFYGIYRNASLSGLLKAEDAASADQLNECSDGVGAAPLFLAKRTIARQISLQSPIARGRFGEVWIGDWRGEKVAVKLTNTRDEKSWSRETEIYSSNVNFYCKYRGKRFVYCQF